MFVRLFVCLFCSVFSFWFWNGFNNQNDVISQCAWILYPLACLESNFFLFASLFVCLPFLFCSCFDICLTSKIMWQNCIDLVSFNIPRELLFILTFVVFVCLFVRLPVLSIYISFVGGKRWTVSMMPTSGEFELIHKILSKDEVKSIYSFFLFFPFLKMKYHRGFFNLFAIGLISTIMPISGEFELIQKPCQKMKSSQSTLFFFSFLFSRWNIIEDFLICLQLVW